MKNSSPTTADDWKRLFTPDSVAVIGASNTPGSWGFGIMCHLLAPAKRRIYPVNPAAPEVLGVTAYRSVVDIPDSIDLAVIVVSAPQVPALLRECVQKGIKAEVIISGGFAETGEQGHKLEAELVEIARQSGLRFVGPNSMGHAETRSQLSTLAWMQKITPGPVALISQSGNMGYRIVHNGMNSGIGFSKFISTGNEASLCLEDYLEYLAIDDDTRIITAYIEGLREGRRFLQLAKEITARKPVVAIKAGGTKASARAAMSHTGAIAGSEAVYSAAFNQSGVIRVEDDDELCDVVFALLSQPLIRDNKIGILTIGGGPGVVAAEACEREGLEIAPLASATIQRLDTCLPPRWSHGNPVDMVGINMIESSTIFTALWVLMEDKNVDAILLQAPLALGDRRVYKIFKAEETKAFITAEKKNLKMLVQRVRKYGKPVFMVRPAPETAADRKASALLRRQGIPVYPTLHRAAKVFRHLARYRQYLDEIVAK